MRRIDKVRTLDAVQLAAWKSALHCPNCKYHVTGQPCEMDTFHCQEALVEYLNQEIDITEELEPGDLIIASNFNKFTYVGYSYVMLECRTFPVSDITIKEVWRFNPDKKKLIKIIDETD